MPTAFVVRERVPSFRNEFLDAENREALAGGGERETLVESDERQHSRTFVGCRARRCELKSISRAEVVDADEPPSVVSQAAGGRNLAPVAGQAVECDQRFGSTLGIEIS